jgi:DNA-binding transcriptional MocR family regulator
MFHLVLVPIEWKGEEMTEAGIRYAVKNAKIKALYLMPDNQNPTQHCMSVRTRQMIARIAREKDLVLIEDSMDRMILDHPLPSIRTYAPERTISILSLSKIVNPAIRIACLAVPEHFYSQLDTALYNLNLSQSALLIEITSRLLVSGKLEGIIQERRRNLEQRNQLTDHILDAWSVQGTKWSLGRWLKLPEGVQSMAFEKRALTRGVSVYGGDRFVIGNKALENGARIAVGTPDTLEKLEKGLNIIRDLLMEIAQNSEAL